MCLHGVQALYGFCTGQGYWVRWQDNINTFNIVLCRGDLGNKMMVYVIIRMLRVLYGVDAYVTRSTVSQLELYFEGVEEIPVAEDNLCGFAKFHKEFQQKEL